MMDTTKPSAAALARAIEGHVILVLATLDRDHYSPIAPIAHDLEVSPEIVRATLRELRRRGLAEFSNGLWSEVHDRPAGAGYRLTEEGRAAAEAGA
ncbi:MAG: hypothetical protein ACE37J_14050 [Pikeienuella sp.]|uniref:hypothetical protein n=1 Tax=Pikeienuella sp. TaxID=2831957 RepID=UPI00391DAEAD